MATEQYEAMMKLNNLEADMADVKKRLNTYERSRVFSLPQETVDSITKANLIDCKDYLESELKQWDENPRDDNNPDGYWIHPDDIVINMKLIRAMKLIIDYYGGEE